MASKIEVIHFNKPLLFAGMGLIALGMILMYADSAEYGFGTLGLTVGSIIALIGFILPVAAVMMPNKKQEKAA